MQHESKLTTLADIIADKRLFNIPIYQRLYVWGSDQIKVLLDDLVAACEADKDVFYLGEHWSLNRGRLHVGILCWILSMASNVLRPCGC